MKNIYKLTVSFFAVLSLMSCGEKDDSFKEPVIKSVTVSEFVISNKADDKYAKYGNISQAARLNLDHLDKYSLGNPASVSFIEDYLNKVKGEKVFKLANLKVTSNGDKDIKEVVVTNLLKTEKVKLELDRYFDEVRTEVDRILSTGVKFEEITEEALVNVSSISFSNEDFFNVLDLLNSEKNKFTVLIPDNLDTTIDNPDIAVGGKIERTPEQLTDLLLNNIIEGRFSTTELPESVVNLNGKSISVVKSENEDNPKRPIYKLNDEITIDPVFRNLDAKSNGFIHQVDKLIVPVEPAP